MGLFRKRSTDPAELDRLRSEIAAMAARLDAADADKAELHGRLHSISTKLDQPPPPPAPPPTPPVVDQADVDLIRARIQRLYDRIDEAEMVPAQPVADSTSVDSLEARVDQLAADLAAALSDDDDPTTPPIIDPAEFRALTERVAALNARLDTPMAPPTSPPPPQPGSTPALGSAEIDDLRSQMDQLLQRMAAIDLRITSTSTELVNQITELSAELEALGTRAPVTTPAAVDDDSVIEVVESLRDAQVRLANEQARYQIAFRQELAALAERLRRA